MSVASGYRVEQSERKRQFGAAALRTFVPPPVPRPPKAPPAGTAWSCLRTHQPGQPVRFQCACSAAGIMFGSYSARPAAALLPVGVRRKTRISRSVRRT
jgi:hypothetical protein